MNNAPGPEANILLCCARIRFDSEAARQLKTLSRKNIDWTRVLQLASAHRVLPLLYQGLNATCPDNVPGRILEQLRDRFYANVGRNLFLTQKLLELLRTFASHGIAAIPYKGPTLAALIYGDLALRQIGDLDVLVRQRDYAKAQQLLISRNFRLTIEHEWEAEFTDESGRVAVDLHRRMIPRDFFCPLHFKYLSRRLQPVAVAGSMVPGLCPADALLMLSLQIAKDSHPQLAKISDIGELLGVYRGLNWTAALKQARKIGGRRLMLFGMAVAGNILGAPLPREVVRALKFESWVYPLVEHTAEQVFQASNAFARERLTSQRFHRLLGERLRDKLYPYYLRYVHGVMVPCQVDRHVFSLPKGLSFLYYFLRPPRLIVKHGSRLIRRAAFYVGISRAIFKDSFRNQAR